MHPATVKCYSFVFLGLTNFTDSNSVLYYTYDIRFMIQSVLNLQNLLADTSR